MSTPTAIWKPGSALYLWKIRFNMGNYMLHKKNDQLCQILPKKNVNFLDNCQSITFCCAPITKEMICNPLEFFFLYSQFVIIVIISRVETGFVRIICC